jgi:AcrR family transcriptional regulator
MSGKAEAKRGVDRRVSRTRNALGDALIALLQETPFEKITVQQILDRAKIGRSTFYAHYRDKDDLFLSDVEEFMELMSTQLLRRAEKSDRVAPVCELFAHVREMRSLHTALTAANKLTDFLELGEGHFARAINRRLTEFPSTRAMSAKQRVAMSHGFAGALFSLMSWWLGQPKPFSPEEMDDIFHRMVWSGVRWESDLKGPSPAKQSG